MRRPKFYTIYRTGTKHIQVIQRFQFYLDLKTPAGVKTKVWCDKTYRTKPR